MQPAKSPILFLFGIGSNANLKKISQGNRYPLLINLITILANFGQN